MEILQVFLKDFLKYSWGEFFSGKNFVEILEGILWIQWAKIRWKVSPEISNEIHVGNYIEIPWKFYRNSVEIL